MLVNINKLSRELDVKYRILEAGNILGAKEANNDFRLILTDLFQQVVNEKVRMSLPGVIDREADARKNVLRGFDTTRGWTEMLKRIINEDMLNEAPHRTLTRTGSL